MKKNLFLVIVIISVYISGCTANTKSAENLTPNNAPSEKSAENPLKNTQWSVESFGMAENRQQILTTKQPLQGSEASVAFTETAFGGKIAGCNLIGGDYTTSGSKFTVKNLSTTVMACSKEILNQETEIMKALEKVSEFRLNGDELDIVYDGGKFIRLKRKKAETK